MSQKQTKQQYLRSKQDLMILYLHPLELIPVESPAHTAEALGLFNMLGVRPIAYQMGHRFYWRQRKAFFYVRTPELLEAVKPLVGRAVFWMPTIDDMIMNAEANNISVSIMTMQKRVYQTYTVLIHDNLFPTLGTIDLVRYSSMDLWFCTAHSLARAFRRRLEEIGTESITPVLYLDDEDFNRMHLRIDLGKTRPTPIEESRQPPKQRRKRQDSWKKSP